MYILVEKVHNMVAFARQQKDISKKIQTEKNFSALDLDAV